ncbi:MAG: M20 family metallopeptidase [Hyphomicrobiaceae bacterium]
MEKPSAESLLNGIRQWIEIESKTSERENVNRMVDCVEQGFRVAGAAVERIAGEDGFGDHLSISSPWGGEQAGILVLCHVDTVHEMGTLKRNPFRIEGDRAYGPGIYDMKGGAYLAFAAFRTLAQAGSAPPLPLRFLYLADEEVGSPTSRMHIETAARRAKYVLVTEPARYGGKIVTARKGLGRYTIKTEGRSAHSGSRHKDGRSAIREMARQIVQIEEMTDYDRGLTFNVGLIQGGSTANTVPQFCTCELDVRYATIADAEETHRLITSIEPFDPDVTVEVTGAINRPPYIQSDGTKALFEHAKTCAAEIGFELEATATGGGSDGNFTAQYAPTLDGLGVDGDGGHTLDEHLYISSLVPRFELQLRLMQTLS